MKLVKPVACHRTGNRDSWKQIVVWDISQFDEETQSDIFDITKQGQFMECDSLVAQVRAYITPEGSGRPGSAFAWEPMFNIMQQFLIMTQMGGLDI